MSAVVYHPGLQTHLESPLVESRTLRLRLPSPKQVPTPQSIDLAFKTCFFDSNIKTHHQEEKINKTETFQNKPNKNNGGWNFLDALSNNIYQNTWKKETTTTTYVHPQQKRSSLAMSPKSLELCTENLGNESGTDIVENDMLLSSMGAMEEQREPCSPVLIATKKPKIHNFPPPLTTMRGSESLRVRPHREDGRLVIEVTKVPPSTSCFQADRSHGRLRLCFLTNETTSFDPEQEEDVDVDDDDVIDENEKPHNKEEELYENEMVGEVIEDVEEEETEEKAEKVELEEVVACEKMKSSDARMEKYEWARRCKEGGENENKEFLNWGESLWVAVATTS